MRNKLGFTLVELLVVIAIIGVLAGVVIAAIGPARGKARDVRRKTDLATIGRFLYSSSCFVPSTGAGDYDIAQMVAELALSNPQYAQYASFVPKDPKSGTGNQTNYRFIAQDANHCAVYANLENEDEAITLPLLTYPAVESGTGILRGSTDGANGTDIYYQISK
jgi:prepilin-type N-terminal cleavage/methylation domain-containing protein